MNPKEQILEAIEMHIIQFEDDWCRNPRAEFETVKNKLAGSSNNEIKEASDFVTCDGKQF
jgi:hypothetical protein